MFASSTSFMHSSDMHRKNVFHHMPRRNVVNHMPRKVYNGVTTVFHDCNTKFILSCKNEKVIVIDKLEAFRLGAISTSLASGAEAILQESRESLDAEKQKLGHGAWRRATVQYVWGFPGPDAISKKCPVITQPLFLKRWRAKSSPSRYF